MPIYQHRKNLAENSSFEKGEDGWTYSSAFTLVTENNIKYMKYEASSNSFNRVYRQVPTIAGHKYYCCSKIKLDNGLSSAEIFLSINPTANYPNPQKSFNRQYFTEETLMTSVLQATDNNSYIGYMLQWNSGYNTGTVTGYIRDFMCVDLTAIYGAGNEPTEQECISLFPYEPYVEPKIKHIEAPTSGKNLFQGRWSQFDNTGGEGTTYAYFQLPEEGYYRMKLIAKKDFTATGTTFIGFTADGGKSTGGVKWAISQGTGDVHIGDIFNINNEFGLNKFRYVSLYGKNEATLKKFIDNFYIQIEKGDTATTYEPYTNIDHFLPSDYQEVEYIENQAGTEYIDTLVAPNTAMFKYEIEFKYMEPNLTTDKYGGGINRTIAFPNVYNNQFRFLPLTTTFPANYNKHNVVISFSQTGSDVTMDGATKHTSTTLTQSNETLLLFKLRNNGEPWSSALMKLYHVRYFLGGYLIRNFIPAKRKSDNEVGLYDTVNNQFYTNQGTGTFIAGPNIVSDKIERAYATNNAGVPSQVFADRLPDELQECEYIQSTGTQYLDSGVYAYKTKAVYKASNPIYTTADSRFVSAYSVNAPQRYYAIFKDSVNYYSARSDYNFNSIQAADAQPHEFIFNDSAEGRVYIDGVLKGKASSFDLNSAMDVTLGIMGNHTNNSSSGWSDSGNTKRLWYLKLYDKVQNKLVRNFIPCYIKPDHTFVDVNGTTQPAGTIGLYDKVNGELYVNAGTGTFTKGRDI